MRRAVFLSVIALVMGLAQPALADEVGSAVNGVRDPNLPIDGTVDSFAQKAAGRIAGSGELTHSDLSKLLGHCTAAGEVIGYGPDVATIMDAFRNSSSHWSIITSQKWTAMGTGAVKDGAGTLWVSIVFCVLANPPASEPPPSSSTSSGSSGGSSSSAPAAPAPKPTPPLLFWQQGPILNLEGNISVLVGVSPFIPEKEWRLLHLPTIS